MHMTITVIDGADATTENVSKLPSGLGIVAGYATGQGIAWTAAQLAQYPGAIIIDQDPQASDPMADVLDVENGAATPADAPAWVARAAADYHAGTRPGQRWPAIYASAAAMPAVTAALREAPAGPPAPYLWVADWTGNRAQAATMLGTHIDTYPVIGVQYANMGAYDVNVFDAAWVTSRSAAPAAAAVPPGQWLNPREWTWKQCVCVGVGLDGQLHSFEYRDGAPWARLA
jgi:hypothetical protein